MLYMKKKETIITLFLLLIIGVNAQKMTWANAILHTTEKFENEENNVTHMLGMPSIYQGVMNGNIDPYSEGYILYNNSTGKKNIITLGFSKTMIAEQLVIGGVMNMGTIRSIHVITPDGKKQEIYQMLKGSVSKFHNFNVYFEPREVSAIQITVDHQKVNNWNIIKGIGLINSNNLIDLQPDVYTDDEFHGKEEFIIYADPKEKCISFSPKLSHDEKKIYFVKECDGKDHQDIWYSELSEFGSWSESKMAPAPLNNDAHNFVASVGTNGKFLILGNAYNKDGTHAGDGVSISHIQKDGTWGIPQTIEIPKLKNINDHANFFMSSDESVLLMAIEDSLSVGELDLYASLKNKETAKWSEPINLGKTINTEFLEDYPFLSVDNKTLYFSSNGYVGFGGHDIYITTRLDDTWQNWSKPMNLGPLVNSKVDDCGFSLFANGNHAFYHTPSVRNDSTKRMDIFRVNIPKMLRQEAKAIISGHVKSAIDTLKNIGTAKIINVKGETVASTEIHAHDEFFTLVVPVGKMYKLSLELENHFREDYLLDFADSTKDLKVLQNAKLVPYADSGTICKLPKVTFNPQNTVVLSLLGLKVDSLVNKIKKQNGCKIDIHVEISEIGDKSKNTKTAQMQAKAIFDYLVSKGIPADKLTYTNLLSTKSKTKYSLIYTSKLKKTNTDNEYIRN
ncbi:MAG: hypothetical protein EAZ53_09945 [Bacteroidetes bacterium]|nr:MAG: hypothetical protein EAZ53_09945 [Bacteroidota bacterium]